MTLEQFLRGKINNVFIPLVKKDKCGMCNSKDKLHLHHMKPFAVMLEETLDELDLKYYNKNDYTDIEIKNITNVMLGKHLDSYYLTLCKDCHFEQIVKKSLKEGMVFKNRKAMCEVLNVKPAKGGNNTKLQNKEFKRYFDWDNPSGKK